MFSYVPSNRPMPRMRKSKHFPGKLSTLRHSIWKLAGCPQKVGEVIYFSSLATGTKAMADASVCYSWLICEIIINY
jgi:hypothetical protein